MSLKSKYGKKDNNQGYVYAPYIMMQSKPLIIDSHYSRKQLLSKILQLI